MERRVSWRLPSQQWRERAPSFRFGYTGLYLVCRYDMESGAATFIAAVWRRGPRGICYDSFVVRALRVLCDARRQPYGEDIAPHLQCGAHVR